MPNSGHHTPLKKKMPRTKSIWRKSLRISEYPCGTVPWPDPGSLCLVPKRSGHQQKQINHQTHPNITRKKRGPRGKQASQYKSTREKKNISPFRPKHSTESRFPCTYRVDPFTIYGSKDRAAIDPNRSGLPGSRNIQRYIKFRLNALNYLPEHGRRNELDNLSCWACNYVAKSEAWHLGFERKRFLQFCS